MIFSTHAKRILASALLAAAGAAAAAPVTITVPKGAVLAYINTFTIAAGFTGDITGSLFGSGGVRLQKVALDGDLDTLQGAAAFSYTGLAAGDYELYAYFPKTLLAGTLTGDVTLTSLAVLPNPPSAVPEPAAMALVLAGLAVVGWRSGRQRPMFKAAAVPASLPTGH